VIFAIINITVIEQMTFKKINWEGRIALLKEYKNIHGHLTGIKKLNPSLSSWITRVRKFRNLLTPEQVRQLEELGFDYTPRAGRWENHIKDLLEFKNAHGHLDVHHSSYRDKSSLMRWVAHIRSDAYCELSPARMKQLDKLGFQHGRDASTGLPLMIHKKVKSRSVTSQQERWEKNMAALRDFKAEHGHCYVPKTYPDNPSLANFFRHVLYGAINCTNERAKDLEELGFDLLGERTPNYPQEIWERSLANLREFKVRIGHTRKME
jgi:hypothetical protein